jgi:hypothetical protein
MKNLILATCILVAGVSTASAQGSYFGTLGSYTGVETAPSGIAPCPRGYGTSGYWPGKCVPTQRAMQALKCEPWRSPETCPFKRTITRKR